MRAHLIKWISIQRFIEEHPGSKSSFQDFRMKIKSADWESLNDVKQTFASADLIKYQRIVFNIGGNNFRLICSYIFGKKMIHLYVKWIGTHAEYDKVCSKNQQYTVEHF